MSKIQLSPYVNLAGRARGGMEFYQRILGGKLELLTMGEKGESKPAGAGDPIAYARLETDGALFIASDGHPKYPAKVGENMAIALNGADKERISKIFKALAEGGQLKGPLTNQPWGGETGYLTDRFGINWVVTVEPAQHQVKEADFRSSAL